MSVIYAVFSTSATGFSDFLASDVIKRVRSHEVTSTVMLAGVVVTAVAAVFWACPPTPSVLVSGVLSGATTGLGILLLFVSYSR